MSGDVLNSWVSIPTATNPVVLANLFKRRVRDLVVFFDGAFAPVGRLLPVEQKVELVNLRKAYRSSHDTIVFADLKIIYVKGHYIHFERHIDNALGIALKFIDPRGLFLVAGNSAGGVDAIEFCKRFEDGKRYFEFSEKPLAPEYNEVDRPVDLGTMTSESTNKSIPIEIDKLWISNGGFSVSSAKRREQARIPKIVASHVNYFMPNYNPPDNDPVAEQDSEFHYKTFWNRGEVIGPVDGLVEYNIQWPCPLPTRDFPSGWSEQKKAYQERAHTQVITQEMEPAVLAEAQATLERQIDFSSLRSLLRSLQGGFQSTPRMRMMGQRLRSLSYP